MRNEIRSNLEDGAISGFLQDYILTNSTVLDVPDAMLSYQENLMIKQYEDYAAYYNMSLEEFLPNIAGVETVDELLASHKDENTQSAKFYLIVQAIAEEANIEVKDANLRAYFEKYAGSADYTQYKDYYGKPYLVMMVQTQNVLDFLRENAVLEQE